MTTRIAPRIPFVGLVLFAGMLLFLGCINNPESTGDADDASAGNGENIKDDGTFGGTLAGILTEGTGTGPNDITTDDLDALQNDLDDLSEDVDAVSESDI
ncbi:MAG: hypothetical protein V1776_00885 [Candidatus Diapherotrites archaeon]